MASSSPRAPVLICGAGPTGLLLSLWLIKYGVPHRIVDRASGPGTASRAIVMHARTLEFYRMLGLSADVVGIGRRIEIGCVVRNGVDYGGPQLGKAGQGLSAFPYVLSVTQDEHEEQLEKRLAKLGVTVERNLEVVAVDAPADGDDRDAKVTLQNTVSGKEEHVEASYVVGCDGAHSGVRRAVGIDMEGGTYPGSFFVTDVNFSGAFQMQGRLNLCVSDEGFMIHLPLPHHEGRARIIGFVPQELKNEDNLTFEHIKPYITKVMPNISVDEVRWFAQYKSHHRCAKRFQFGNRVFLCGDSAHLHSPVGGQGMNTGLGDASNLAWKLATAWHADAEQDCKALLQSYEAERLPFARLLVHTTDRAFATIINQGWGGYLLRMFLFPYLLPFITKYLNLGKPIFRRVSQTAIAYRASPLSADVGRKSGIAGARLPWVDRAGAQEMQDKVEAVEADIIEGNNDDNHAVLDAEGWQAHLFTEHVRAEDVPNVAERLGRTKVESVLRDNQVPLKVFPWSSAAESAGFRKDSIYLVRPDGYAGLVISRTTDAETLLEDYLGKWGAGILPARARN